MGKQMIPASREEKAELLKRENKTTKLQAIGYSAILAVGAIYTQLVPSNTYNPAQQNDVQILIWKNEKNTYRITTNRDGEQIEMVYADRYSDGQRNILRGWRNLSSSFYDCGPNSEQTSCTDEQQANIKMTLESAVQLEELQQKMMRDDIQSWP